jgi:hypothetical protein
MFNLLLALKSFCLLLTCGVVAGSVLDFFLRASIEPMTRETAQVVTRRKNPRALVPAIMGRGILV